MSERAIGYVRISSQEQRRSGRGLAVQERAIREHCKSAGLRLLGVERDEARSGSNGLETRPGLAAVLAALERGEASVLVVDDYSRLARDLILQETTIARLAETGVRVVSVQEPAGSGDDATRTLIRQVLGAVNQYNRAVTRAKMEAGRRAAVEAGRRGAGAPPYGFKAEGGRLYPEPQEQAVMARIRALADEGASLNRIAVLLNNEGLLPRRGRWHPETVRRALERTNPE
jgi:DNA invertase Pin-like site-specific DNA recombinase